MKMLTGVHSALLENLPPRHLLTPAEHVERLEKRIASRVPELQRLRQKLARARTHVEHQETKHEIVRLNGDQGADRAEIRWWEEYSHRGGEM